ncbi:GCN5 family N-acetyltransferase [Rhizocola hellebori]|uniref:GCN5 family N-acetyltransferase n=1 Tax=Rhizocola hellebori TaxID=1392758 RepID=A0A8J3QIP4_9ACTN|nr:GNAT family N-acetyltransferase [Rhizocola hellebori]GIH10474.1 GCN5 family N-acetyltransferase [Rhizocola hellebori]
MIIRRAGEEGKVHALALLDRAAEWLVERGRTGQWGTEKQSTSPRRLAQAQPWADSGGFYLAWNDDVPVGALVVGQAPAHIPPAGEPELYVNLLVTDRRHAGEGVGAAMLDYARDLARAQGVRLLRLDCYAGDDRALVAYYEKQGFSATETFSFEIRDTVWPGQVMQLRL